MPHRYLERRLRVLHIIPTLGIGGAEKQLAHLLVKMDRLRFQQSVCFYTPSETYEEELRTAGIQTIFFDKFSLSRWNFFTRLRRVVRDVQPDVVHTWLYSANFWGRLAALSCGIRRLIASDRSMVTAPPTYVYLYEKLFAALTVRLANSRAVAASLGQHYGLRLERIRIIRNAVDLGTIDSEAARAAVRSELGLPFGQRLILMAARQTPEKNHAMFFRVAKRVGERRPDVTFLALGYMPRPNELGHLLESLGACPYVRLLQQTDDIARWVAAADLFCLTSNMEGLPNVVLEAMAAGLPVVCSDFDSARELIPDSRVGIIVPREDDAAMAEVILEFIDEAEHRRAVGAAARRHVTLHFSWNRLVEEMESLYMGVVSGTIRPHSESLLGPAPEEEGSNAQVRSERHGRTAS